ncbi:MAG: hypothetical protein ACRD12_22035 [Acidimicrobiales bacterium]
MKKRYLLLVIALALTIAAAGSAGAQTSGGLGGRVQMTMHTHSAGTLLFPIDRLAYSIPVGETFAYSSRRCTANAPFNDVGLNFIPDYPGVDSATGFASVRYGISGVVAASNGDRGSVQGQIRAVLCIPGDSPTGRVESGNAIQMSFWASFARTDANNVHIQGGFQFLPNESTGTFRDLQGGGTIQGRFTCLSGSCAELGEFTDFVGSTGNPNLGPGLLQPGLFGTWFDPTIGPIAGPVG